MTLQHLIGNTISRQERCDVLLPSDPQSCPGATMPATVRNNAARNRYELEVEGHTAVAVYTLAPGVMTFVHTEVPPELGGKGVGSPLVRGALEDARRPVLKVLVRCSFVRAYMTKHPEFNDLLA